MAGKAAARGGSCASAWRRIAAAWLLYGAALLPHGCFMAPHCCRVGAVWRSRGGSEQLLEDEGGAQAAYLLENLLNLLRVILEFLQIID